MLISRCILVAYLLGKNAEHVSSLPIRNCQNGFKIIIPLWLVVDLPSWASCYGIRNQILKILECTDEEEFRRLENRGLVACDLSDVGSLARATGEISWEYSFIQLQAQGWDSELDHAWVNRICLFLRRWYTESQNLS